MARRKGEKIPEDWVKCPVCFLEYGFVRCRITSGGKNYCLSCFIAEKKQRAKMKEGESVKSQTHPTS